MNRFLVNVGVFVFFVLSLSMILASFRSLGREFNGVVMTKTEDSGMTSAYWLNLVPSDKASLHSKSTKEVLLFLSEKTEGRRVGVSSIVFHQAKIGHFISKVSNSPYIFVDSDPYLDLGLQWMILGVIGVIISIVAYKKARIDEPSLGDSVNAV